MRAGWPAVSPTASRPRAAHPQATTTACDTATFADAGAAPRPTSSPNLGGTPPPGAGRARKDADGAGATSLSVNPQCHRRPPDPEPRIRRRQQPHATRRPSRMQAPRPAPPPPQTSEAPRPPGRGGPEGTQTGWDADRKAGRAKGTQTGGTLPTPTACRDARRLISGSSERRPAGWGQGANPLRAMSSARATRVRIP